MLECVQKSSCTLRLQLQLIDFQPGTTSTEPYATGLKPTGVLGAPAVGGAETSNKTSARRRRRSRDERRRYLTGTQQRAVFPLHPNRDEKDPLGTDASFFCSLHRSSWSPGRSPKTDLSEVKGQKRRKARPRQAWRPPPKALISTHLKVGEPGCH